jgi:hypothetical protein
MLQESSIMTQRATLPCAKTFSLPSISVVLPAPMSMRFIRKERYSPSACISSVSSVKISGAELISVIIEIKEKVPVSDVFDQIFMIGE